VPSERPISPPNRIAHFLVHAIERNGAKPREESKSPLASKGRRILETQQRLDRRISTLTAFIRKYTVFGTERDCDPLVQEVKDILLQEGSADEEGCDDDPNSSDWEHVPARDHSSLRADIVTLRLHVAELELANDQLETKLKRYRQTLKLLKKDMNAYRNHMKLYTSELAHRGIEINTLNEKITQLLNNNNDSSTSTTATPSPHTTTTPSPLTPSSQALGKVLPSPPRLQTDRPTPLDIAC
jgi:hypothetical protein